MEQVISKQIRQKSEKREKADTHEAREGSLFH